MYLLRSLVHLPVEMELASEFRYGDPVIDPTTLVIAMSQSGETADTIEAVRIAQASGMRRPGHLQRPRFASDAARRRHALHARRPRDRRRGDQDLRLAGHRNDALRAVSRQASRDRRRAAPARDRRRHEAAAGGRRRRAQHVRRDSQGRARAAQGAERAFHRALRQLSRPRSRARSNSKRSRTSTPRAIRPAR